MLRLKIPDLSPLTWLENVLRFTKITQFFLRWNRKWTEVSWQPSNRLSQHHHPLLLYVIFTCYESLILIVWSKFIIFMVCRNVQWQCFILAILCCVKKKCNIFIWNVEQKNKATEHLNSLELSTRRYIFTLIRLNPIRSIQWGVKILNWGKTSTGPGSVVHIGVKN